MVSPSLQLISSSPIKIDCSRLAKEAVKHLRPLSALASPKSRTSLQKLHDLLSNDLRALQMRTMTAQRGKAKEKQI